MKLARLCAVLASTCCLAVVSACGSDDAGSSKASSGNAVLRVGQPPFSAVDSSNPFAAGLTLQFAPAYPTLVRYTAGLDRIVPDFASRWETSADGKSWTFTTQPDAKWSDGTPLTAKDVAFTVNTMAKFRDGPAAGLVSFTIPSATGAEAIDDTTVRIDFSVKGATVLSGLVSMFILPEHVWRAHATADGLATFANKPPVVSGGPFIWEKFTPGQFAYYVRNPNWYGEKPKLKAFGLQQFSDEDAMIAALKSGQIDTVDYISPGNLSALEDDPGLVTRSVPGLGLDLLAINVNDKKPNFRELLDPKVREAIDLAIDRDKMVSVVYQGRAQAGVGHLPLASSFADTSLERTPYDPDQANQLLDEAGYERGDDGIRQADGHAMKYEVIFPTFLHGPGDREFQILKDNLKAIGIALEKKAVDSDAAVDLITGPDNKYLDATLSMGNITPSADPSGFLGSLTCQAWGANNRSGNCERSYDALWAKQEAEQDPDARQQVLDEMQQYAKERRAVLPLVYPDWAYAWSKDVSGIEAGPQGLNVSSASFVNVDKKG